MRRLGMAQPLVLPLSATGRWGTLLRPESQSKKVGEAASKSAHSLEQNHGQSIALMQHYGEINVCCCKSLGFGTCLVWWQKPQDWRKKVSPTEFHPRAGTAAFSASIVPKLEPMANPFALPPVFSKRMLRASSTPEKLNG